MTAYFLMIPKSVPLPPHASSHQEVPQVPPVEYFRPELITSNNPKPHPQQPLSGDAGVTPAAEAPSFGGGIILLGYCSIGSLCPLMASMKPWLPNNTPDSLSHLQLSVASHCPKFKIQIPTHTFKTLHDQSLSHANHPNCVLPSPMEPRMRFFPCCNYPCLPPLFTRIQTVFVKATGEWRNFLGASRTLALESLFLRS